MFFDWKLVLLIINAGLLTVAQEAKPLMRSNNLQAGYEHTEKRLQSMTINEHAVISEDKTGKKEAWSPTCLSQNMWGAVLPTAGMIAWYQHEYISGSVWPSSVGSFFHERGKRGNQRRADMFTKLHHRNLCNKDTLGCTSGYR